MVYDFCKHWTFRKDGSAPVNIELPHDAMILEKRDGGCCNGVNSGYFPGGKYTYEKVFEIAGEEIGKSIDLHFEGVYQNCKVYINQKLAGSHRYGYTPFDVDISNAVSAGSNTVTVHVDNSLEPNCRWYSGSGIYRPVQLLIRNRVHIEVVHIETVSIHPAQVKVDVTTTAEAAVSVEIWDKDALVASGKPGIIAVPNGKLWSAEDPYLYTCVIRTEKDERKLQFGIRELKWSAKTGLTVKMGANQQSTIMDNHPVFKEILLCIVFVSPSAIKVIK